MEMVDELDRNCDIKLKKKFKSHPYSKKFYKQGDLREEVLKSRYKKGTFGSELKKFWKENKEDLFKYFIPFIGVIIYFITGQYKSLTRYIDSYSFYKIGIRNIFVTLLLALVSNFFNLSNISNRALLIFWLILTSMESVLRIVLKDFLSFSKNTNKSNNYIKKVAIYGAGEAGTQLYSILKTSRSRRVKVFIDDEKSLSFREIDGIQIKQPIVLDKLIKEIDEILIAIPSLSRSKIKNLQ